MARTTWKQIEREAAACLKAKRFWANEGGRVDIDSPFFACQVKNPKQLPLAELVRLVEEMQVLGIDTGRLPIVFVKWSGGAGRPSPLLAVLPADAWCAILELCYDQLAALDVKALVAATLKESKGLRQRVAAYVAKAMNKPRI